MEKKFPFRGAQGLTWFNLESAKDGNGSGNFRNFMRSLGNLICFYFINEIDQLPYRFQKN